jgi:hypothetical protein
MFYRAMFIYVVLELRRSYAPDPFPRSWLQRSAIFHRGTAVLFRGAPRSLLNNVYKEVKISTKGANKF